MKSIAISEIGGSSLRAENLIVFSQHWRGRSYSYMECARPDSGLMLLQAGQVRVVLPDGDSFFAAAGDLLSLPAGSHYRSEFNHTDRQTDDLLINFHLLAPDGAEMLLSERPALLQQGVSQQLAERFRSAQRAFSSARGKLRLKACVYEILDELCQESERGAGDSNFALIRPGVELLENSVTENISVRELADRCSVSESTFRRFFHRYAGVTPTEYRDRIRISLAKQLLSGRELTVQEISAQLGFYDSAYFCRVFKEKTGQRPGEYQKDRLNGRFSRSDGPNG